MENKTMPGQVNCAVELPRARTRRINVGGVAMGAGAPVVVQSMLTAPTANPEAAIAQAKGLAEAGCEIVRAAIPNSSALDGFAQLCRACPVPVVADIHFDHRLAVRACELGASGLRINPGNIGSWDKVDAVIDAARATGIPIRIVNDLLFDMTRVKLLVEISTDEKGEDSSYLPAEDLQRLSVGTLLERLDAEGKWTIDLDWKQMDSNTWEQSKQLYKQYIEGQRQLLLKDICMNNQQSES